MKKEFLEKFKKNLEKEKTTLKKDLESFAKKDRNTKYDWNAKYPNQDYSDTEDKADEAEEYDNLLSLEESLELKLKNVDLALERIKKGDYGKCQKCGKEIEEKRLLAYPEARFCIKCNT